MITWLGDTISIKAIGRHFNFSSLVVCVCPDGCKWCMYCFLVGVIGVANKVQNCQVEEILALKFFSYSLVTC